VLALGVPIVDTLFALVRRFLERRPLFSPDSAHIHHRLLAAGITHRRAVLIIYAICIVFTVAAMSIALGHSWEAGISLVAASIVLLGLVRFVGYFEYLHIVRRQKARVRGRDAELLRYALPSLPEKLKRARCEGDVWDTLTEFMADTDLAYFEVLEVNDGHERVAFKRSNGRHGGAERDLVTSRYPLGRDSDAAADIKFAWVSDFGDVAPQSDILLQIAADVVAEGLSRHGSRFAPACIAHDSEELVAPQLLDLTTSAR
jgi:UDP-GlcNAc:undecaprenyl-phosphate GlcNAc-1-phosphate transferase